MKPTRVFSIILGSLVAMIGLGLFAGGARLGWAVAFERDSQGYFASPTERYSTPSYALTSQRIDLTDIGSRDWWARRNLASVRIRARATGKSNVFVGIAPVRDVESFLAGVPHDEISRVTFSPFVVNYRSQHTDEKGIPTPPTAQKFWVASATGPGSQAVRWKIEPGDWAVVVMNADGSRAVVSDIDAGLKAGALTPIALGLGAFGMVMMVVGGVLIVAGGSSRRGGGGTRPSDHATEGVDGSPALVDLTSPANNLRPVSPVRLEGQLDPTLSRWMWLVKWILVIPHVIVLAFLWIGFVVTTVIAFFAILVTGRYPRSLFDYNVGVLRWTWRVGFYSTGVMATDEYPPFSLSDRSYPAQLEVAYPIRLSRGLIFVKWLLALPHLIIVGVLTATWSTQSNSSGWRYGFNGGVLGLLAVVAAVILLFSGKYPKGLFDFLMGCNRWIYRTIAYVGLMTDEYPPFRFDQGPTEPRGMGPVPSSPSSSSPSSPSPSSGPVSSSIPAAPMTSPTDTNVKVPVSL
jgi:Domain of unknown function (DUF4389)